MDELGNSDKLAETCKLGKSGLLVAPDDNSLSNLFGVIDLNNLQSVFLIDGDQLF